MILSDDEVTALWMKHIDAVAEDAQIQRFAWALVQAEQVKMRARRVEMMKQMFPDEPDMWD